MNLCKILNVVKMQFHCFCNDIDKYLLKFPAKNPRVLAENYKLKTGFINVKILLSLTMRQTLLS